MIQVKFNDKAKQVLADTLDLSGSVVVTELPQVGEPHTIYELQETSKTSYGWVFSGIPSNNRLSDYFLVFDTYEQMTTTINAIEIGENTLGVDFYAYIRTTNKMYLFYEETPEDGDPSWVFEEQQKKEDESGTDYAFQLDALENYQTFYILKEFVGNERPIVDGGYEYTYLTLDNKEVYIGHKGCGYILSNIVHPSEVSAWEFIISEANITSNTLPNSVELEQDYHNLLRASGGDAICYNTSDNKYYVLSESTGDYYWYDNQKDREDCYFAQVVEYEIDKPPHYVGELEWTEMQPDDLPNYNEIPYDDIINVKLDDPLWIFQPKKGGEITSTYWIYTNSKWVNVDEISNYTTNQIFVYTVGDYEDRPDRAITLVEMNMELEEPVVISEVPYEIIDKNHIIFYNVPSNKTLYVCIDESLISPSNTYVESYDFDINFYDRMNHKAYYDFNIETVGGSIEVDGSTE